MLALLCSLWLMLAFGALGLDFNQDPSIVNSSVHFDRLSQFALTKTINRISAKASDNTNHGCTLDTLRVRRNWAAFTPPEKRSYIDSILCLTELPPLTPPELASGPRSRFDDFVAVHINQSYHVHRDVRTRV